MFIVTLIANFASVHVELDDSYYKKFLKGDIEIFAYQ